MSDSMDALTDEQREAVALLLKDVPVRGFEELMRAQKPTRCPHCTKPHADCECSDRI